MKLKSLIGIALLVIGAVVLWVGFNSTQAPAEELTEAFTGQYTDQTMMYLIGGGVVAIIGLVLLLKK